MKAETFTLKDAFVFSLTSSEDFRGSFFETWNASIFKEKNISFDPKRHAICINPNTLTLRGMHFQKSPHGDAKVVTVLQGKAWDVLIDLRKDSPTYLKWVGIELSAQNKKAVFIPAGIAHGYLTLEEHTTVSYLISAEYHKESSGGVRWNDPAFKINWPQKPKHISPQDLSFPEMGPE